jgi:hypothetical protein
MRRRSRCRTALRAALPAALLAFTLGCGGPTFVFPGGALEGEAKPVPSSWAFAADAGTIQFETRPEDPYSVNIVCVVVGEQLYVSAGDNHSQWVENMEVNPLVRARIEGGLYELRAERVTNDAEMAAFAKGWTDKVSFGRDPTELDEAFVFRLSER